MNESEQPPPSERRIGRPPRPAERIAAEREALQGLFDQHGGNADEMAKALGITKSALQKRLSRLGMTNPHETLPPETEEAVAAALRAGASYGDIKRDFGVSIGDARGVARRAELPRKQGGRRPSKPN